jgi:hypothetical protein
MGLRQAGARPEADAILEFQFQQYADLASGVN